MTYNHTSDQREELQREMSRVRDKDTSTDYARVEPSPSIREPSAASEGLPHTEQMPSRLIDPESLDSPAKPNSLLDAIQSLRETYARDMEERNKLQEAIKEAQSQTQSRTNEFVFERF
jgi:hypothetical protein